MGLIDTKKLETIQHPSEPGVTFEIRPLLGTEMDEAQEQQQKHQLVVWGSSLDAIAKMADTVKPSNGESPEMRLASYHKTTLLKYALVDWSYEVPPTPENIALLDKETRDWLALEVVKRNTRPTILQSVGGRS